jgi:hypothetical protein
MGGWWKVRTDDASKSLTIGLVALQSMHRRLVAALFTPPMKADFLHLMVALARFWRLRPF